MSDKTSFKSKVLNIATLGYVNRKAKEVSSKTNQEIKFSKNQEFNTKDFINFLGGFQNIISISATLTTLKVNFNEKSLIQIENIKKMGAKGIIFSDTYLSIVFGDWAKDLEREILDLKAKGVNNV